MVGIEFVGELLPFTAWKKLLSRHSKNVYSFQKSQELSQLIGHTIHWEPPYFKNENVVATSKKILFIFTKHLPLWQHILWSKRQSIGDIKGLQRLLAQHNQCAGLLIEVWLN